MSQVYIGNLNARISEQELEDKFRTYRVLRRMWVARKPPGYAFIDFDDHRDAQDAIRNLIVNITGGLSFPNIIKVVMTVVIVIVVLKNLTVVAIVVVAKLT